MRSVYVAAAASDAPVASTVSAALRRAGIRVVSGWHDAAAPADSVSRESRDSAGMRAVAESRCADIRRSDTVVLLWRQGADDALCEAATGYCLGHDVLVVADPFDAPTMLHRAGVRWFPDVDGVMAYLAQANGRAA